MPGSPPGPDTAAPRRSGRTRKRGAGKSAGSQRSRPGLPLGVTELPDLQPKETKRLKQLKRQLAQLGARRKETERQVRAALARARLLQEDDVIRTRASEQERTAERAEWVTSVVRREISKPLKFTEAELGAFDETQARFDMDRQRELERSRALFRQASLLVASRSSSVLQAAGPSSAPGAMSADARDVSPPAGSSSAPHSSAGFAHQAGFAVPAGARGGQRDASPPAATS